MKYLAAINLILIFVNVTVWAITAWKCWRIGGSDGARVFGRTLARHFLSLGLGFLLIIAGGLGGPEGSATRIGFAFLGMICISVASAWFLMSITGRGE